MFLIMTPILQKKINYASNGWFIKTGKGNIQNVNNKKNISKLQSPEIITYEKYLTP